MNWLSNQLVADGLLRRPELAQSRHLVAAAEAQLSRERYAPLLPNVLLDVSQTISRCAVSPTR